MDNAGGREVFPRDIKAASPAEDIYRGNHIVFGTEKEKSDYENYKADYGTGTCAFSR